MKSKKMVTGVPSILAYVKGDLMHLILHMVILEVRCS